MGLPARAQAFDDLSSLIPGRMHAQLRHDLTELGAGNVTVVDGRSTQSPKAVLGRVAIPGGTVECEVWAFQAEHLGKSGGEIYETAIVRAALRVSGTVDIEQ